MTTSDIRPSFIYFVVNVLAGSRADRMTETPPVEEAEHINAFNRRAHIHDVMSRNTDAFTSDHDVEFLMRQFPG